MEKYKVYLLIVSAFMFVGIGVSALTNDDIHSNEALLVNIKTDEVLFHKNTNVDKVPIASLTKLMTYAVVLDEISDLENTKITVPSGMVQYMANKGASSAHLLDEYSYSVLELLYGLMLPSGCDAAEVLALYIGNGNSDIFVQKMNQKAVALGMNNTLYIDSYGIGTATADNMSTEEDQYKLIKYLYDKPYFRQIISTEYHEIIGQKDEMYDKHTIRNTNYLMGNYSGGAYYYPYSIGGKTGTLDVSGKCLTTIAKKNDLEVVAITLGVPNQYSSAYDYNLTDNIKLLKYAFDELSQNITIDVGPLYRSLEIGKKLQIKATTSASTPITWESSDPSVASVDQNGIVTAKSQGQVKITAKTKTGNIAYTYISVNFYNGIHVDNKTGPALGNNQYDPIDFALLKSKGYDYVVIRTTVGSTITDKSFYKNFESAIKNGMNIGIWVDSWAENLEEAQWEAEYLIQILNSVDKKKINLPIFYNILHASAINTQTLEQMIKKFNSLVSQEGYTVVVEDSNTRLETLDLDGLKNENIDFSVIYRQLPPDYKTTMSIGGIDTPFWNYKSSAYTGIEGYGTDALFSLMYMNYKKINTIHKVYVPIVVVNTNTNKTSNNTYKVNKKKVNVEENNNEEESIQKTNGVKKEEIINNIKSGKKAKRKKENKKGPDYLLWGGIIIGLGILLGIIRFLIKNNDEN